MKKLNILYILFAATILIGSASCKKTFLDPQINVSPNNAKIASDASLLPSSIVPAAYNTGGTLSWYTSMWDQQTVGADRQFSAFTGFTTSTGDYDAIWTNLYQNSLINATILNQQANAQGNVYYAGIAKVLIAYQMGLITDLWGDVPYSNAFIGATGVITPTFDKQQDIYTSLFKLLDSAKVQLGSAKGGALTPGADDVSSYKGNPASWLKLANVLTARLAIHLVKVDPAYAQKAISAIQAGGFVTNADNFSVAFGTDQNSNNPNYQLNSQRGGYMGYGGLYLPHAMYVLNDPRLSLYIKGYADATATATDLGDYFGSQFTPAAPVVMVTLAEQNFILAEAFLRNGSPLLAQNAYTQGINASMTQFGLDITGSTVKAYMLANGTLSANATTAMQSVMTQKYFALYLNPESYTDYRRTGFPVLTSPTAGTAIPRRFLYPLQEYSYNKANVPAGTNLTTHVFWDK